jgi:hypothetical protein
MMMMSRKRTFRTKVMDVLVADGSTSSFLWYFQVQKMLSGRYIDE